MRNNPIAIAQGAEDAPRIQDEAFEAGAVGIHPAILFDEVVAAGPTEQTVFCPGRAVCTADGTYRVTADGRKNVSSGAGGPVAFYKNGVIFYSSPTITGTSYQTYSYDIALSVGDIISWSVQKGGTGGESTLVQMRRCRIYCNYRFLQFQPLF
jgi:hypothetical protein